MNAYVLLLRNESIDFGSYSADEMAKIMADFDAWNAQLISKGQLIASASLQGGGGKTLRGSIVSDGPYCEAKEAVAGLLIVQAPNETEAVAMAAQCPFLVRGGSVEVRLAPQLEFEDAARAIVEAHASARIAQKEG